MIILHMKEPYTEVSPLSPIEIKEVKPSPEVFEHMRVMQANDGTIHHYLLTDERIQKLFNRGERFFMAYQDGKPIGFGSYDFETHAYLHFLSVYLDHQRQGAGRSIMNTMLEECRLSGASQVHTFVEEGSDKERFLEHMGFKQSGNFEHKYGEGQHASIWRYTFNDHSTVDQVEGLTGVDITLATPIQAPEETQPVSWS